MPLPVAPRQQVLYLYQELLLAEPETSLSEARWRAGIFLTRVPFIPSTPKVTGWPLTPCCAGLYQSLFVASEVLWQWHRLLSSLLFSVAPRHEDCEVRETEISSWKEKTLSVNSTFLFTSQGRNRELGFCPQGCGFLAPGKVTYLKQNCFFHCSINPPFYPFLPFLSPSLCSSFPPSLPSFVCFFQDLSVITQAALEIMIFLSQLPKQLRLRMCILVPDLPFSMWLFLALNLKYWNFPHWLLGLS